MAARTGLLPDGRFGSIQVTSMNAAINWNEAQRRRLKELHLDPHRGHPEKLRTLVRHFSQVPEGTVGAVTEGGPPHVSKTLARKVRDLTRCKQLDWVLVGEDPSSETVNGEPPVDAPDPEFLRRHRDEIERQAKLIADQLSAAVPVPSDLCRFDARLGHVPWDAADAIAELKVEPTVYAAVVQHLGWDTEVIADSLFDDLAGYQRMARDSISNTARSLMRSLPHEGATKRSVAATTAVTLFQGLADQALVASEKYRPTRDMPLDRALLEQAAPTVSPDHLDQSMFVIRLGRHAIGFPTARREADSLARITEDAGGQLKGRVETVVEAYFRLLDKRDLLRAQLAPMAVQKWAVAGSCDLCQ